MKKLFVAVCAATQNKNWRWLADKLPPDDIDWLFVYYEPAAINKIVRRPDVGKIMASWRTARQALRLDSDLIVTQEAETAFWTALFCRLLLVNTPHVAIAFNYPNRPHGIRAILMKYAFKYIDKFDISSTYERNLYSSYFSIPSEKFDVQLWKMGAFNAAISKPIVEGKYVCALGEFKRDYETLLEAAHALPNIKFVLVVRPNRLKNLLIPVNVRVLENIPNDDAYNVISYSSFMVLPLATAHTPTGHITLVSAMHMGKASVVTQSSGIQDYLRDNHTLTYEAGNARELARQIHKLWSDPDLCAAMGDNAKEFAMRYCSEEAAVKHLHRRISEFRRNRRL